MLIKANKAAAAKQKKKNRQITTDFVNQLKKLPCVDCGKAYPDFPGVMEFDHCRGLKSFGINEGIRNRRSIASIKKEIEKTDLVCVLCHRLRTEKRRLGII